MTQSTETASYIERSNSSTTSGFLTFKKIGWSIISVQFLALASWKTFMFSRFSGTFDESIYQQGVFLISRGNIDPVATIKSLPLIRDHATILAWLLSPLDWIPPTGLFLLLASVAAVAWAELVAFNWICYLIERVELRRVSLHQAHLIGGVGLLLLVANPWTWWAISWDFHVEELGAPLIIAAAFEFSRRRYRVAWIWVAALFLTGDVGSTWILGLGVSALLASVFQRDFRFSNLKIAGSLFLIGVAEVLGPSALGLSQGSNLSRLYGYLTVPVGHIPQPKIKSIALIKSILFHPIRVASVLLKQKIVFFQNLAPFGFFGIMTIWTFGVPSTILFENTLTRNFFFGFPGFQSLPVYTFAPVGICSILLVVLNRFKWRRILVVVCTVLAINCLVWEAVFLPHLKGQWVHVTKQQAAILAQIDSQIPADDEVIASQGIISRFSFRRYIYTDFFAHKFPLRTKDVYFVISPTAGIEGPVNLTDEEIGQLSSLSFAHLVLSKDDIYLFELNTPSAMKRLRLPKENTSEAWLSSGVVGHVLKTGSPRQWRVVSNGQAGYVIDGDYWHESEGIYRATVNLSNVAPVNIEVWNEDAHELLAREQLTPNPMMHEVALNFDVVRTVNPPVAYSGSGYFHVQWNPLTPDPQNQIEIRVYDVNGGPVSISSLSISSQNQTN